MAEQKRGGPRGHGPQGHGFQRPKDFRGTVSKLLRYIGRYKAALVVVFICLVISSVGSVMSSYLLKPIINDYILVGDFAGLLKMLALLLGLFLLSGLCSYAYARIMVHISQRTVAQMRQDLFDKLQDLPLRYFDTHQSGDLMSRFTNDMDTVSEMINSSFASVVSCALTFIGIVVMMLYMNWVLTLITFAFLVLMLLVVKGVGGRSRVSFQAQQQALGAMNGYIEEMVEGQKVIKVFNHESKAIAQFSGLNDSYRDAATAAQTYSGAMMPAMANLSRIDYAVTCCVGGLLAIGGMFDVGSLGAYLLYVKQVSQPISQISQQVNVLLAAVAGAERIFAVMEAEPEVDEGKTVIVSGSGNQGITASVPVVEYAKELNVSRDQMVRAVLLSDLLTIHLKTGIGRLSAYCGAVSAGCSAGAAIAYLHGGGFREIAHTLVNSLAIVSGMICDGAKASCAAKISAAVDAGLVGYSMFRSGQQFRGGDGIVTKGVEETIRNIGRLGRLGMRETDREIIRIMTNQPASEEAD